MAWITSGHEWAKAITKYLLIDREHNGTKKDLPSDQDANRARLVGQ
jgi:hypothetical protein